MPKLLPILAGLVGILFCVVGVMYFAEPASSLPSFFPGFQLTSPVHHFKHGVGAVLLGVATFAFAWFASNPRKRV